MDQATADALRTVTEVLDRLNKRLAVVERKLVWDDLKKEDRATFAPAHLNNPVQPDHQHHWSAFGVCKCGANVSEEAT